MVFQIPRTILSNKPVFRMPVFRTQTTADPVKVTSATLSSIILSLRTAFMPSQRMSGVGYHALLWVILIIEHCQFNRL